MAPALNTTVLYRIALWMLAIALLVLLFNCAAGAGDRADSGKGDPSKGTPPAGAYTPERPMRLVLGGSEARDSAAVITEFYVDQALRAALDSVPAARYVTINYRDSLADVFVREGKKGIPLDELGHRLNLDGVIFTRIARFSSALAVETRIVDPGSGRVLFRDLSFSIIRYRDTAGTMFLGPTLYDAVRKSVGRYFGMPHLAELPVATEPLVIINTEIPSDPALGQVRVQRQGFSTKVVMAFGELARLNFPELVGFDYESRRELMRTVGIGGVDDYMPMSALERQALYNVGIDRFVTSKVSVDGDSILLRVELRFVTSRTTDSLIDAQERRYPRTKFESTKAEEDFVIAMIDQAEPLFAREAGRVQAAYAAARKATMPSVQR